MVKKATSVKFHGMRTVSNQDCVSVRNHNVLEVSSAGILVVRYYNNNGLDEDSPIEINPYDFLKPGVKESNITSAIKKEVGKNKLLISDSAVSLIKSYVSDFSK